MRKKVSKLLAIVLVVSTLVEPVQAYDVSNTYQEHGVISEVKGEQISVDREKTDDDKDWNLEVTTPSMVALESKSFKLEATYNTMVRSGRYQDMSSTLTSEMLPKQYLDAKQTKSDIDGNRKSYITFSVPADVNWEAINDIRLMLCAQRRMGTDNNDTMEVYITETSKVSEENMTWNNAPAIDSTAVKVGQITLSNDVKDEWVEIDVTEKLREYLKNEQVIHEGEQKELTICVLDPTPSDQGGTRFYSKYTEEGVYNPYLIFSDQGYKDVIAPKLNVTGIINDSDVRSETLNFNIAIKDNYDSAPKVHILVNGIETMGQNGENKIILCEGKNEISIYATDASGNNSPINQYTIRYIKSNQFKTIADTYIQQDKVEINFGQNNSILLKRANTAQTERKAYFSFNLDGYKKDYVKKATINLYVTELMGNDRTNEKICIYETEKFDENTLTWGNAKDEGAFVTSGTIERSNATMVNNKPMINAFRSIDITDYINEKLAKDKSINEVNFVMEDEVSHDQKGFYMMSKEGGKEAYIEIEEGLPDPIIEVSGIEDNMSLTNEVLKNVVIKARSINPSIPVNIEVYVNNSLLDKQENNLYDLPLKVGDNKINIIATDPEGNRSQKSYSIIRFKYQEATIYYVDSMMGNDINDGMSEKTAWKSLKRLNESEFKPGTKILFKRGSVWNGQFRPKGSGVPGTPIIVDVYGEGAKPIINGQGVSNKDTGNIIAEGAVHLYNVEYWEINNLEVTNNGSVIDKAMNRAGIMVYAGGFGEMNHIYIKNCYVHDVNTDCKGQKLSGGVLILGDTRDEKGRETGIKTTIDDVIVDGCHIKNVAIEGLRTKTYDKGQNTPTGDRRNSNVVFKNNLIEDIHGDGIVISEIAKGGLVEKNIIRRHSTCPATLNYAGCWVWNTDSVLLQYNEVCDGVNGYNDGEAFDFDIGAANTVYQYNYSHNNKGGLLLTMQDAGENNVFRYNISQNDGNGCELFFCANPRTNIYNNTIYVGKDITLPYIIDASNPQDMTFKNNIFYIEGKVEKFANTKKKFNGNKMQNNCIYPANILSLVGGPIKGTDIGTITEKPLLENPAQACEIMNEWDQTIWDRNTSNFKLKSESPCINAGVLVQDAGEHDFYGNALYQDKPDIGAHEFKKNKGE